MPWPLSNHGATFDILNVEADMNEIYTKYSTLLLHVISMGMLILFDISNNLMYPELN